MIDEMEMPTIPIQPQLAGLEAAHSLSPALVLGVLKRKRRLIFVTSLLCLFVATLVAFLLPPNFTASASFIPPGSNSESSAGMLMGQLASISAGGSFEVRGKADLYIAILKSHTVAEAMVQRFNLRQVYRLKKESLAERGLAAASFFSVGTKDPVITIEVTDHSAERARDLANGYLETLQATTAGMALSESSQRRLFYEQRLAHEKDELANAEVAMKQVEEKTGLVEPTGQTSMNIQALAQVQAQITSAQAQLASLLQDETNQNPDVLRLRSQIGSLQAKASEMESGAEKGFGRLSTAQVPDAELEFIRKARDVKYHESLFEIIAKQYEAARLDEAKDAPLQVLDRPSVPDMKSGPSRRIIMAVGLLLGLLGSSAWVLLRSELARVKASRRNTESRIMF